jgi:hypothetical protein
MHILEINIYFSTSASGPYFKYKNMKTTARLTVVLSNSLSKLESNPHVSEHVYQVRYSPSAGLKSDLI